MSQVQSEKEVTKKDTNIPLYPDNLSIENDASHHLSKGKKLVKKVKQKQTNLKSIWVAGHAATLIFGIIYACFYVLHKQRNKFALGAYKLSLLSVWITYAISIQSQFNIKALTHYSSLIASENFEYFLLSIFWFFNRSSLFKILPYIMISILHLSTHFKLNGILKFEKQFSAVFMYNELFLFVLLLVDTLLFRGTSGYGLVAYACFSWLRLLQSENARFFLYAQLIKFDSLILKIKNKNVQEAWAFIKKFLSTKQAQFEHDFFQS